MISFQVKIEYQSSPKDKLEPNKGVSHEWCLNGKWNVFCNAITIRVIPFNFIGRGLEFFAGPLVAFSQFPTPPPGLI